MGLRAFICRMAVFAVWLGVAAIALAADEPRLNFEEDIVPILEARCVQCHGSEIRKAGLDLRRKFTMVAGGDSGTALVPGQPAESLLIEKIVNKEMPPKGEDPLDQKQIDILRKWVLSGAPTKLPTELPLEMNDADETVSDDDRQFWAFQPPQRVVPPSVKNAARVRTPIDAFLLAKLEENDITFNPDAPKSTLLRRLYFDLIGLPPTPEQIVAFQSDNRADAYERLVDELLASPHYGERWGRHWLDIAGYADSDGYLEADRERPEAWRYRDYVIRALNNDKPYDQFIREQIAGDELSDWRRAEELTPDMIEQLIATGFLRTASDPTYPGYKEKTEIYKVLADTVQIVGSTFFGVTVQCARCHAHKSEPISQRDYYQLQAVFAAAYDPDPKRWLASGERAIPLATEGQLAKWNERNQLIDQRAAWLSGELQQLTEKHRGVLVDEKLAAAESFQRLSDADRAAIRAALLVPAEKRTPAQKKLLTEKAVQVDVTEDELKAKFPEFVEEAAKLNAAIKAEQALKKVPVSLRGLTDMGDTPPESFVLRRGDFNNRGKSVDASVPVVLASPDFKLQPQAGYKTTGRRRAFADWLVDAQHPTTARVHVNRLWATHFGRGLVETIDDFGHLGKRPTHPELLDWLATEFISRGWSQKAIHRLMVTSTAYRQSSAFDAVKSAVDADNRLLWAWRPQRHTGEVVRDTVLSVSGKLNLQPFGPPVAVVRQADGSVTTANDDAGHRRSVYLKVRRSQPVTMLEAFDTPRMEINCARRTEATVPTQALVMLNSPFIENAAKSLSSRIVAHATTRLQRIEFAWNVLFSRPSSESERKRVEKFLDGYVRHELGDKFSSATAEDLSTAENSAWPHVALTLLNTNEFLFVD